MKKENFGLLIAVLSVIASGIISWYFYDKSQQYRTPTYSADIFPSTVYMAKAKSNLPFTVLNKDGNPITENIYLATHYFWNKGKRPILNNDILEPLTVQMHGEDLNILNVSIRKMSRSVVNCSIKNFISKNNSFNISYNVLEENDGCSIDLIYTGTRNPEISLSGTVVGVDEIEMHSKTIDDYFENRSFYDFYKRFLPGLIVILPFSIVLIMYYRNRNIPAHRFWIHIPIYIIFVAQMYVILELKIGSSSFTINNERPAIDCWTHTPDSPQKDNTQTTQTTSD